MFRTEEQRGRKLTGHDPDHDGLGTELEDRIGTCTSLNSIKGNWDCSLSTDPRDTDGDALPDGLELYGKIDEPPYESLPKWGANPRHKDIFVEVDYRRREQHQSNIKMTPQVAREAAAAYADLANATQPATVEALYHAVTLNNPDRAPGISVHFDIGIASESPADATIYGDWGGYNAVPAVQDDQGNWVGQDVDDAYSVHLRPSRKGIFHYILGNVDVNGQCPLSTVKCHGIDIARSSNVVHEFAHTLRLDHSGPMSSDYDANCKVSYPSIMSYAPPNELVFSDGYGRPAFNNTALPERNAVSPSTTRGRALLARLNDIYGYLVDLDEGHVDWNRDGVFSSGVVQAYANNDTSGQCEFTSTNFIRTAAYSLRPPSLTRAHGYLYAFYFKFNGDLAFQFTSSDLVCEPGEGCPGTTFTQWPIDRAWNGGLTAMDTHRVVEGAQEKVLLVFANAKNELWETKISLLSGAPIVGDPVRVSIAGTVSGEFSLTGTDDNVWLCFKDPSGQIYLMQRNSAGQWQPAIRAIQPDGSNVPLVPAIASPAIVQVAGGLIYGAFPRWTNSNDVGRLKIWTYDQSTQRWNDANLLDSNTPTLGKPAMAYRPFPSGMGLPGRLHLYWIPRRNDGSPGVLRENWLAYHRGTDGIWRIDMKFSLYHSNASHRANAVDVLFEPGVDANIRLLESRHPSDPEEHADQVGELQLRPKADGIVDLIQADKNDWRGLGIGLCRTLTPHGPGAEKIKCPEWPF